MKHPRRSLAAFAAFCVLSVAAYAADASGTWKWSQPGRGDAPAREASVTLAVKDGKLTGQATLPGRGGDAGAPVAIANGSVNGDTISFTVERQRGDNKIVTKYTGKLSGDTITGTSEGPGRDGQVQSREWVAKRSK